MIWQKILYISFTIFLMIVSVEDIKTMRISDGVLLFFSILHMSLQILSGTRLEFSLGGIVSGFIIYYSLYRVSIKIYKEEGFGYGDVLLISSIGIVLGSQKTILAAFLAFYVALLPILYIWLRHGRIRGKEAIPFAPSICLSAFIVLLFGDRLLYWLSNLFIY